MGPVMWLLAPTRTPGARTMDRIIWENAFSGDSEDREHAIQDFNRHNEEVKEHVPTDQLLVYEVKDGWEPLCEFLEPGAPEDKPFPRLNDTVAFGGWSGGASR